MINTNIFIIWNKKLLKDQIFINLKRITMKDLHEYFKESYLDLMDDSLSHKKDNPNMSFIGISTITMICDLSCSIDIQALSNNFCSTTYPICTLKKTKAHDEYEVSKRGKTRKSFYNQSTVNYTDHSTKSMKVFSNGRLQITGLSSVADAKNAVNILCEILRKSYGSVKAKEITVKDCSIAMINSNFSFNVGIDILKIKKDLEKSEHDVGIIYNPEVYPGLKIKHKTSKGTSSLFVFTTGNVVITGVKSIQEIIESFSMIASTVNSKLDTYKTILKPPKAKIRKSDVSKHGYPLHLYNAVI